VKKKTPPAPPPPPAAPFVRRAPFGPDPWIVGCIGEPDLLRACAATPPDFCDLVEIRLDLLGGMEDAEILDACRALSSNSLPVLATLRRADQGGRWDGPEADRHARLLALASTGAIAAVDLELLAPGAVEFLRDFKAATGLHTVGSHHDFKRWPDDSLIDTLLDQAVAAGVSVFKLAANIENLWALEMALRTIRRARARIPVSLQGMQPYGMACRAPFVHAGSCCVYGALGGELVIGQPTCRWLAERLGRLGPVPRCTQETLRRMLDG
jgi:3-dehydroquinate dehydratase type I